MFTLIRGAIKVNFAVAMTTVGFGSIMFGLLTDPIAGVLFFMAVPSMAYYGNWWAIWVIVSIVALLALLVFAAVTRRRDIKSREIEKCFD
jgi:hypothetical protein